MESVVINTRADLDAITGTPEHVAFMALLAGTLWRLEKDDTAQAWVAIEDNSTIGRFGFSRADFHDAQPPTLPEYVSPVEPEIVVSPWQIRKALNATGLRDAVEAAVAQADQATQDAWQYATEFREFDPLVLALGAGLGKTPEEMHALFELAASL